MDSSTRRCIPRSPSPSNGGRPSALVGQAPLAHSLSTYPVPFRHSQPPFFSTHFPSNESSSNEKIRADNPSLDVLSGVQSQPNGIVNLPPQSSAYLHPSTYSAHTSSPYSPRRAGRHIALPTSTTLFASPHPSLHCSHPQARRMRLLSLMKPWLPLILYLSTSLGFLLAVAFWKEEVFQGLDDLSTWLKQDESFGYAVLFFLIFVTTFPPLPLYSTLIILSGYTFGPWIGAIISYWAALSGALVVFLLSRYLLRNSISTWLSGCTSIKRVVRAIEKRPKLLFLIRLAPYPYNVMNCLLGASPTLSLRTYLVCTALSLFKVIIHTTLGSSIHSFADYHVKARPDGSSNSGDILLPEEEESALAHYSTIGGIMLCLGIFVYLSYVARKAVDEELEDDEVLPTHTTEERIAFLSPVAERSWDDDTETSMSETPFRPSTPTAAAAIMLGGR